MMMCGLTKKKKNLNITEYQSVGVKIKIKIEINKYLNETYFSNLNHEKEQKV